jgi:tetratricopeptide (TPR) repeat protein
LQRHLCHAIQQSYNFLNNDWGVPDEAKKFATQCDQEFGGLRFYPFVRRFNCADAASYHKAEDDGFKITVASPQLVPAACWNKLCYNVHFAPRYVPAPNPHINEWHSHNPPPGTVYDLNPRLDHPSLISRPDVVGFFEKLHQLAPCDCRISEFILTRKYKDSPTEGQALALFQQVMPYSIAAMRLVAKTVYDKPGEYEKYLLQAAEADPTCYYDLGDYENKRQEQDKAEEYIDKACASDLDSVRVANHAYGRVLYYVKKGQTEKARKIADVAGEVYSYWGLYAKAAFLEETTNYDGAFEWFQKIEERYDESQPLIGFCLRCKTRGDAQFEPEIQKRIGKLFPKGMERAALADFKEPPRDGVQIMGQSDRLRHAGLRAGDVVVALGGTRTHTVAQYTYLRDSQSSPELELIAWQGSSYHEFRASLPNRRFGVDISDYKPQ